MTVSGLKPHAEYVFALAAHGPGGKVIGQSPGIPTDPILASYSLSHCVGCGLLCQYAYKTGNYSIAGKSAGMIWKRFVASLTTDDMGAIPQYKLRPEVLSTTPTPLLRLFAVSILIGAHSRILSKRLHPNTALPLTTPPYTSQQERLNLVGKLRVGLSVCGWLNDHALSLQMVVMCYTLLVPFIQTSLSIRSVIEVLVQCLTVLHSLPDNVVISKQITVISGLHHITAVIGHTLIKAFSSPGLKTTALPIVSDMCRSRLIFTLPAAHFTNQDTPTKGGLQNSSLTSTLSSSVTGSMSYSVYGSSAVLPTTTLTMNSDKVTNKYKKRKRKALSIGDTIPEEMKTVQYKTIDGFYMYTNSGSTGSDDVDLTGQEDPALLHNAINLLSIQAAYKEVAKFKRRPQYLEYIVHLANKAFSQGKGELVVDWCQEVFTWIKKRNEIILSAKSPQAAKTDSNKDQSLKTHTQNSLTSSFNHHIVPSGSKTTGGVTAPTKAIDNTRNTSGSATTKRVKESRESGRSDSKGGASVSPTKKSSTTTNPANKAAISSKLMNEYKNLLGVRQDGKKGMITKPRVTRDDLRAKAISVFQNILPRVWRVSRCRKRFRTVSNEEKPWRAQINIFLAYCNLQSIIDRIYCATPIDLNECAFDWFRLDVCGQLLEWAVPSHPPSMPKESSQDRNQSNTTPTNESPPQYDTAQLEKDLSQLMTHLQRALVLAHRGGCLVLVVNVCRLIWNTVSILRHYIYTNHSSQGLTASLLYGTALGCLYIAGDILIDVYKDIEKCINGEQVSLSSASLLFDRTFLHQFLLLVVNVCYSNHHWEKILTLEQQMDANTKLSLRDYLKPIVTETRANLQLRIEAHSSAITKQAVDPAAHLDVRAYNLYGTVGYSLGMSAIPLDSAHDDSIKEEQMTPPNKGEEILKHARYLYSQYLSTRISQEISEASLSEIEHITDCYKEALKELKKEEDGENERSLKLQALHELGNILFYMNDTKSAAMWWVKGLKFLFHCKDPLSQWRSLDLFKKGCPLQLLGVWGCIIGGILASKMARLIHNSELDVRLEYHHLTAALFKSLFRFSMPHPLRDIDYARYILSTPLSLQFGIELFTDQFRCSLSLFITSLHDTAKEMVSRGHVHKALPVISLFEHFSSQLARSVPYTVLARVCKAEALVQLSLYGDAIQCIKGLMTGADLPVLSNTYHTASEGSSGGTGFNDHLPLNNSKNIKALSSLTDKTLSPSLKELYGTESVSAVLVVKSRLLVKLAATCPGIMSRDLSTCRHHDYRSSSLTSVPSQGSLSKSLSASVSWSKLRGNQDITSEDVKMALLEHSEKTLNEVLQETSVDISVRVHGYLILSQISTSLSNYSSAVNLSLAAIRMLQNIDGSVNFDPLLWLQTRITLADNVAVLTTPLHPELATPTICKDGIKEAQAMGEYELSAHFMYISAMYSFISVQPLDVGGVRGDITECLHTLENCVELSLNGELLRCRASLLLAEVSLENDGEETNYDSMGKIYQGISRILGEQVLSMLVDDTAHNLYTPQLHLKLISDLRLAYCISKTDSTQQQYKAMVKDGLSLMESVHYTTVVNEIMMVEYQSVLALLAAAQARSSNKETMIAALHLNAKALVEAISGCTSSGIDYIRTYQLYITLCETLVALGNITTPTIINTPPTSRSANKVSTMESSQESVAMKLSIPFTGGSPSSSPRRKGITSQLSVDGGGVSPSGGKSSPGGGDLMSPRRKGITSQLSVDVSGSKQRTRRSSYGGVSVPPLADNKMVPKEYYQSWCAFKLANAIMERYETLAQLSSELHNTEMNTPIPPSLLSKLPDGVISDLCPVYEATTEKLLTDYELPPLDMLLPLTAPTAMSDLTWFSLLGYYYSLQRKCFRPSPLWEGPRTHCLSNVLIPRVKAVLKFLSIHCPLFCSNCVLVKLPPPLSTLLPKAAVSGETTPIATPNEILPHLVCDEGEVSVSWYQPGDAGSLKGLLSINHKALRSVLSIPPSVSFMKHSGAEVFTISSDPAQLAELRSMWEELDKRCSQYVTEQAARPLSRSPSRMKKKSIEMAKKGVPSELQENIQKCVEKLIQTLSVKCFPVPVISPQSITSINRVIRALKPIPERGDAYLFFKQVFLKDIL